PGAVNLIRNTASVSGVTDNHPHSATESTPIVPSATLSIAKSHAASPSPWMVGGPGSFDITVGNDGPSPEYGPITVSDRLPVGVSFESATGSGWECDLVSGDAFGPNGTVVCVAPRPTDLDPADSMLGVGAHLPAIDISVTVLPDAAPQPLPATNVVVNSASVVGVTDTATHTDDDQVDILPVVDLEISKTDDGSPFHVGEQGTYLLTVTNHGPNVSSAPTVVTDELPQGLTFVSGEGNDWTCGAEGQVVTCELSSSLPVDATSTISLVVDIGASAVDGSGSGDGVIVNTASVTGPDHDPGDHSNNSATHGVTISPAVDLAIDKSHVADAEVGQLATFILVVSNVGPNRHGDGLITVVDELPAGLQMTAAAGDGWSCIVVGQTATCTRNGPLEVGAAFAPITLKALVGTAAEGGVTNRATVATTERDPNPANNSDSDPVVVIPVSNLSILKSLLSPLKVGDTATWRLHVTNNGPSVAPNVVIGDVVPTGMTVTRVDSAGAACVVAGQAVHCTVLSMAVGASVIVDIVVEVVLMPDIGEYSNTATVVSPNRDPAPIDNTSTATGKVTAVAQRPPGENAGGGSGNSTGNGGGGVTLPVTGAAVVGVLGAGLAFSLSGLLLLGGGRRRRRDDELGDDELGGEPGQ
ncbi:MAG: hypothetical protein RLZZ623_3016, partial [Actinomycetota bacterium]